MVKIFDKYDFPEEFYFSKDHMWAKIENSRVRVGLTDFGQKAAGKILMVRPRPLGKTVEKGKILGTMETGKWVGPLRAPVKGAIIDFNDDLRNVSKADIINKDPYGEGWIFILEPSDLENDLESLMTDPREIESWLEDEKKKLGIEA